MDVQFTGMYTIKSVTIFCDCSIKHANATKIVLKIKDRTYKMTEGIQYMNNLL